MPSHLLCDIVLKYEEEVWRTAKLCLKFFQPCLDAHQLLPGDKNTYFVYTSTKHFKHSHIIPIILNSNLKSNLEFYKKKNAFFCSYQELLF